MPPEYLGEKVTATHKHQTIRWCTQCEEQLPTRCAKCIKHPDRKPRVVEIFDAPTIIKTNECGCVGFKCQRNKCTAPGLVWRHPRADGTLGYKNHFCSPNCVRLVTAAARVAKRVTLPCSCGCGKMLTRPASNMRSKYIYFSQKHHYDHRVQLKAAFRRETIPEDVQAFVCTSKTCRGEIIDHTRVRAGVYKCVRCNFYRGEAATSATNAGELHSLNR